MNLRAIDLVNELLALINNMNDDGALDAHANLGAIALAQEGLDRAAEEGDLKAVQKYSGEITDYAIESGRNTGVTETLGPFLDLAMDWAKKLKDQAEGGGGPG